MHLVGDLSRDLHFSVRLLAKSPFLSFAVVLSLAMGIGLNTAVFSLVNTLLVRPVSGVREPEKIVVVYGMAEEGPSYLPISQPNYRDFAERNQSFTLLAIHQLARVGLSLEGETEQVVAELVSPNFFATLGIELALGRAFAPENLQAENPSVIVLSHGFWQSRFAADPEVLGKGIRLNGHPFTIIGVAKESFWGINAVAAPKLWAPLEAYRVLSSYPDLYDLRDGQVFQVTGRLKSGVSHAQAQEEMGGIAVALEEEHPASNEGLSITLVPLSQATVHPNRRHALVRAGGLLMLLVGLLLLITCVNVANLLLARATTRGREMVIRVALGADRRRLARQLLTESLLLCTLGGAGGVVVAGWVSGWLWSLRPPLFEASGLAPVLDWRVMGFLVALSLFTGLCFGISPLVQILRQGLSFSRLVYSGSRVAGWMSSVTRALVVLQVALCCVILTSSGLLLKHLTRVRQLQPGFETERLLTASYDLRFRGYDEGQGRLFHDRLSRHLSSLPGVESVALAEVAVFGGFRMQRRVVPVGVKNNVEEALLGSIVVSEEYFQTVGIPILRGRGFDGRDRNGAPFVAVINEAMARWLWPGIDPIGRHVRLDEEISSVEVVGVVKDAKHLGLTENPGPLFYLPLSQRYSPAMALHVRTSGPPSRLLQSVRREFQSMDRDLPLVELRPITESIERSLWIQRLSAGAMALLGLLALGLASVGLYGVMSYFVGSRSRELGVRVALGAHRLTLLSYVLLEGGRIVGIGLILGLAPAVLLGSRLAALLREGGSEATTFLLVSFLMMGTAALANAVPALRAMQVDPMESLRTE